MKKLMLYAVLILSLCVCLAVGVSAKSLTLWTADDLAGSWGATPVSVFEAGAVDKAVSTSIASNDVTPAIICYAWNDAPLDISAYTEGYLHFYVYISDAGAISVGDGMGVIEFSSDSGATSYSWQISDKLVTGWNELKLNFADSSTKNADLKSINYMRLFQYGTTYTLAIDQVEVVMPDSEETTAETAAPETEQAVETVSETEAPVTDSVVQTTDTAISSPSTRDIIIPAILICAILSAAVIYKSKKKSI